MTPPVANSRSLLACATAANIETTNSAYNDVEWFTAPLSPDTQYFAMRLKWALIYLCWAVLVTGACRAANPEPDSLYARMGGAAKVGAVVDEAIEHAAGDSRTRRSFEEVSRRSRPW